MNLGCSINAASVHGSVPPASFSNCIPIGILDSFNVGSVFVNKRHANLRSIRLRPPSPNVCSGLSNRDCQLEDSTRSGLWGWFYIARPFGNRGSLWQPVKVTPTRRWPRMDRRIGLGLVPDYADANWLPFTPPLTNFCATGRHRSGIESASNER